MPYRTLRLSDRVLRTMDAYLWTGDVAGSVWIEAPAMTVGGAFVNGTPSANTLYAWPFVLPLGGVIDRTQVRVTSTPQAGALARVGLYVAGALRDIYPARLVKDIAEFSLASTGVKADTTEIPLMGGAVYWLAYLSNNSAVNIRLIPSTEARALSHVLTIASDLGTPPHGLSVAQTYGALPDPFPAGAGLTPVNMPLVGVKLKR